MKNLVPKRGWWFSNDDKRGFAWSEVAGFMYHEAGSLGVAKSTLYLYLRSGIMNLSGAEADDVYGQIEKGKGKSEKIVQHGED